MKWYLGHFPTATSFLASGALITGEASPGYLPYPDVAYLVSKRLPGPRIVVVGRNPLERAWSSYRYNYVTPTIDLMKRGAFKEIPPGQPSDFYDDYLFPFEDMVISELAVLRKCVSPGGAAEVGALERYGNTSWGQLAINKRQKHGLPPLVDLDSFCYGGFVNSSVVRAQWAELVAKYPEKVVDQRNVHLKQSFIGRSLYTLPLEWWYALFPKRDIYFICTEELSDFSGMPLNELARFLGLPDHNFSSIVQGGAYNVGGHTGYDHEISWEVVKRDEEQGSEIPLSDSIRQEVIEFIKPFNERLFNLTGRRCNW